MPKLREVEGGEEKGDGGGDDEHAHLVAKHVAEMSPKHSAETVENSSKGTDHCKKVIIVDELLPKCFVHGVDVADSLSVKQKCEPENPELGRLHNLAGVHIFCVRRWTG